MADLFTEMEKDGVVLHVHPTCVAAHKTAGWKIVKENVPFKADKPKGGQKPKDEPEPVEEPSEKDDE